MILLPKIKTTSKKSCRNLFLLQTYNILFGVYMCVPMTLTMMKTAVTAAPTAAMMMWQKNNTEIKNKTNIHMYKQLQNSSKKSSNVSFAKYSFYPFYHFLCHVNDNSVKIENYCIDYFVHIKKIRAILFSLFVGAMNKNQIPNGIAPKISSLFQTN